VDGGAGCLLNLWPVRSGGSNRARWKSPARCGFWLRQMIPPRALLELELDRVEVAVGFYSADIVATDASSNRKVVIENQLEKTNHDHLGKVLTYASGLEARILIWIAKKFT
jgi:hypothetical protein